ncbi:MAG TPA: hypothetical protein VHK01_17055, partial [Lacipirellulaceae bacterium]|nr:hypothetical protein [Lacipirellulaceae bacterium]
MALLGSRDAHAGETWDGGGANDNWTTGENWNFTGRDEFPPPNNGTADVRFAGNQGTSPNVDVPYSIRSLSFDSGSVSFFITGQELTIGVGGIVNMDNSNQFVSAPVRLAANNVWRSTAGLLYIDVVNLNGHSVLLQGHFPITLGDTISGAGDLYLINNFTSTATMQGSGNNTYTGVTEVQEGTLELQKGGVAVPGDLIIRDGGVVRLDGNEQISQAAANEVTVFAGGQLNVYDHTETLNRLVLDGGSAWATANGRITAAEAVVRGATGYWLNYGTLYVGETADATLEISNGGDVSSANGYVGNQTNVSGEVTVDGMGSTWLSGGSLEVGRFGPGVLNVTNAGEVRSNGILVVGDHGDGVVNITAGGKLSNANGAIGQNYTGNSSSDGSGTVIVDGTGSTWNNANLTVGLDNEGMLDITNGGRVNVAGVTIINSSGQTRLTNGTLICDGDLSMGGSLRADSNSVLRFAAAQLRNRASLAIENGSSFTQTGSLTLEAGAAMEIKSGATYTLDSNNSSDIAGIGTRFDPARVTVDGAHTRFTTTNTIFIGHSGTGEMSVTGGARVEVPSGAVGGIQSSPAPPIGTLTLEGRDANGNPSSWLTSGALNLGLDTTSQGTISVLNGALLRATVGMTLGLMGRGNIMVSGTDGAGNPSLLDVGTLAIASLSSATGELTASGGGRIKVGNLSLAASGGTATVTMTDVGSSLEQNGTATITVGHAASGMATVNVRNDAMLTTGTGSINVYPTGQINLESGAVFDARGPININGGQFNFRGGTLHVDAFNGNLVNEGGTLAPGHSLGTTAVSGNYTQRSAAALEIEIADVFPGDWDVLTVGGNAILDGTLEVLLLDDFEPVIGNSFPIIMTDAGNIGGQFDVELFPVVNGRTFDVIYNAKSVVLQVIEATLPGDYNGDGSVDAADYVVWRKNDGTQPSYDTWRANFGRTAGSGSGATGSASASGTTAGWAPPEGWASSAAVPEPGTLLLALAGL